MDLRVKSLQFDVKDADAKQGVVKGYLSAFNKKDSDGDIIVKGAFAKSIQERGPKSSLPRIKYLLNHDPGQPLGVFTELQEDGYGLQYTAKIGSHTLGKDFLKMAESGIVTEHSIGFKTINEERRSDANYLKEISLFEGSALTGWAANPHTPLTEIKSLKPETVLDYIKNVEKFCRNTTASDETIMMLHKSCKTMATLLTGTEEERRILLAVQQVKRNIQSSKYI